MSYWESFDWIGFWINIGIALVGGLFTSVFFLLLFWKLRPTLKISKNIVRYTDSTGKDIYQIKFYNQSRFNAVDLKMELHICRPVSAPGGQNLEMKELELEDKDMWYLSNFEDVVGKRKRNKKVKSQYASFAKLVSITEKDFEKLWRSNESSYLSFKVSARHGFSGFHRVVRQSYHDVHSSLQEGKFKNGNTFDIAKVNQTTPNERTS